LNQSSLQEIVWVKQGKAATAKSLANPRDFYADLATARRKKLVCSSGSCITFPSSQIMFIPINVKLLLKTFVQLILGGNENGKI
jgi:hypothetical protein